MKAEIDVDYLAGFILTMRNVNEMKAEIDVDYLAGFILTMRNVNVLNHNLFVSKMYVLY